MTPAPRGSVRQWLAARPVAAGYILAVGSALSYGTAQFVARIAVTRVAPPLVTTAFALLFGALFLLPLGIGHFRRARRAPGKAWLFIVLAGLTAASGVAFMYSAFSLVPLVVASPLGSVYPLVAIGLTHLFLQRLERVTPRLVAGAALVVAGVVLVVVGSA
ncbi:MAG: EamA family transporter [Chloroflexi bacterium]|nr:EamA family transporter [Chloroflexota bacterium]